MYLSGILIFSCKEIVISNFGLEPLIKEYET